MGGLKKICLVNFLLLLFVVETCLNCKHFKEGPISSLYAENIQNLRESFPLDYLTEMVTNLKEDNWCSDIWNMYFFQKEFERIYNVSGESLKMSISDVLRDLNFTKACIFSISEYCVIERKTNISVLLYNALSVGERMKRAMKSPVNLANCSNILCDKGAAVTRSYPTNSYGVPLHRDFLDKDNQESDTSQEETTDWKGYFIFAATIIAIIFCIFILFVCRRNCGTQSVPLPEQEGIPLRDNLEHRHQNEIISDS